MAWFYPNDPNQHANYRSKPKRKRHTKWAGGKKKKKKRPKTGLHIVYAVLLQHGKAYELRCQILETLGSSPRTLSTISI